MNEDNEDEEEEEHDDGEDLEDKEEEEDDMSMFPVCLAICSVKTNIAQMQLEHHGLKLSKHSRIAMTFVLTVLIHSLSYSGSNYSCFIVLQLLQPGLCLQLRVGPSSLSSIFLR